MRHPTIKDAVGRRLLVALQRIGAQLNQQRGNVVLGKLEGSNPADSVKDRPALSRSAVSKSAGRSSPATR